MGTIQIDGSTPKLTIGNATAEDATILYDGNAKDFYIALDDSSDKLVIGEGSTVGTNSILTITDDSVTVGDAAAVDTKIVFDGNAQDYYVGLDDSSDSLVLGLGSALGTTPAITINSSQVATFAQAPVFPDGSIAIDDLNIDGGTDIGAALVDADEIIVDDGGGGTNRRCDMSRVKTYIGAASAMNDLSDVSMDITNFTDSIVIQTDSDGSAPTTGTLSSATGNIGIGKGVFTALTSATYNVVIGYEAGDAITSGEENVFIGKGAGSAITTAGGNVAIGKGAYQYCDDEESNIAIGLNALGSGSLNGGEENVCIGKFTGDAVTSGDKNVLVGHNTGSAITTGSQNIFIGEGIATGLTTGSNNIMIGRASGIDDSDGANRIALGCDPITAADDNHFYFGKASNVVSNDFSSDANWARASDVRKKRNIHDQELGLDFINDLRTVRFQWKPSNEFPKEWYDYNEENKMDLDITMHGFIAQEVKEALDKHASENDKKFRGWSEGKDGMQNTSREMFVIPLIKAIQELTAE